MVKQSNETKKDDKKVDGRLRHELANCGYVVLGAENPRFEEDAIVKFYSSYNLGGRTAIEDPFLAGGISEAFNYKRYLINQKNIEAYNSLNDDDKKNYSKPSEFKVSSDELVSLKKNYEFLKTSEQVRINDFNSLYESLKGAQVYDLLSNKEGKLRFEFSDILKDKLNKDDDDKVTKEVRNTFRENYLYSNLLPQLVNFSTNRKLSVLEEIAKAA